MPETNWSLVGTNLMTNPSFRTKGAAVAQRTNLATNPSFETVNAGTQEVSRNLIPDPGAKVGTGWGMYFPVGTGDVTYATGNGPAVVSGGTFRRITITAATSGGGHMADTATVAVNAFSWIVASAYVRQSVARRLRASIEWYNSSGAYVSESPGTYVVVPANTWTRLSITASCPSGATKARITLFTDEDRAVGETIDASAALIEKDTQVLGPYFDGTSAQVGDFLHSWAGTVNASDSIKYGQSVTGAGGANNNAAAFSSTEWRSTGTKSLRFIGRNTNTNTYGSITPAVSVVAGKTYTIQAKIRIAAPLTGTLGTNPRSLAAYFPATADLPRSSSVPNVPGEHDVRMTVVAPAGNTTMDVRAYLGASKGNGEMWVDDVLVTEGSYVGPYFDGSTVPTDPDFTYAWTGAANASQSEQRALGVPGNFTNLPNETSVKWYMHGSVAKAVVSDTSTPGGRSIFIPNLTVGKQYTVLLRARNVGANPALRWAGAYNSPELNLTDQFEDRYTTFTASDTTLYLQNTNTIDVGFEAESILLVEGNWTLPYFDGSVPDIIPTESYGETGARYTWTGPVDASTSTYEAGIVIPVPDPVSYDLMLERLTRTLHDVTCISGPIIEQKLHRNNMWGYIVEFTLAAGTPWLFGATREISIPPGFPIVVQDVPFNLVPYPSAEIGTGVATVATNYSPNPSVEVNTTGWVASGLTPVPVLSRTNELASHPTSGGYSAKATFTATSNSAAAGWLALHQEVNIPAVTGTRISVNIWASGSVQSGTAVVGNILIDTVWYNGTTYVSESVIGTMPASGGALSVKSILIPAGVNKVMIRARLEVPSYSSGAIIRLYADALAVTVP
jgi:hypothetical protein